jgi:hypothetical protein
MKERVNIEWAKQFLQSLAAKQIKKWRDQATQMHLISQPESKIPEAAAAEILEDYKMLWMDRRHVCENNMKKERKGITAASRHLFILILPLFTPLAISLNKCNAIWRMNRWNLLTLSTNSLRKLVILVIIAIISHLVIIGKCEGCLRVSVVREAEPNDQQPY